MFKLGKVKEIKPAITWTPVSVGGFWVAVPVCMDCLDPPKEAPQEQPQHKNLVDPYTGKAIQRDPSNS